MLRPWRAVLLGESLYALDTGNYGGRGMVTVWNRDLEEVGRFGAMPHTVDLVEACDGQVATVFQAVSGSGEWPAYGLAVRRQGRWAPVGQARPDTIPLTGSWEDTRAVVTGGGVLLLGLRGLLHRLSCDGASTSAELLAFRSRPRRFPIHRGAATVDSIAVFFWAHPTDRRTTRVTAADTSGRDMREYVLEGDYRLHGFNRGIYWVVHLAAGASPQVLRMEPERFVHWLAGS
ncbi:MAG: hypothetical protein ACN0LA_01870 [Candidatus Longimicrobiales bacterium M2_2A_002]